MPISIHTFLAEGDEAMLSDSLSHLQISIHTFLAEGDASPSEYVPRYPISIHTFLAEGDFLGYSVYADGTNFNPHLPRGR